MKTMLGIALIFAMAIGVPAAGGSPESSDQEARIAALEARIEALESSAAASAFPVTVVHPARRPVVFDSAEALGWFAEDTAVDLNDLRARLDWAQDRDPSWRSDPLKVVLYEYADHRDPGVYGGGKK